jgi:hypothetical protein
MERRAKVELFEQIRREYEFGIGSIKGVARKLGVHRRMVRQALANADPPRRKQSCCRRPVMGPLIPFIDSILRADRSYRASNAIQPTGSGSGAAAKSRNSRWPK